MEHTSNGEDSPSNSSNDQAGNRRGWEKFLPERALRVLLVEEDSSTRQVVSALLSRCGYEVSSASDGSKAWDLLQQTNMIFDLVLADATMPLSSGTDLLVKIMSSEAHRDIPVIMMSSHDSLDMVFKCLLKGAKDFLVKPLRKNELRNLWQHVWRRNHASSGGGSGSEGGAQGKKRKATRNLSSGDTSNDNFSISSGVDDQNVRRDDSNAQVSRANRSDMKFKRECDEVLGGKCNDAHGEGERFSPSGQRADSLQDSDTSGRSAKAFDFIGTMSTEPVPAQDFSKSNLGKPTLEASHKCQGSPALELTLRQNNSTSNAAGGQGIHQSSYSAFSKYTGKASATQQWCIARSASLLSDQGVHAHESTTDGPRTTLEISGRVNEIIAAPGNAGPQTLHFPKASHFNNGRQYGNSSLSILSSCGDENGRQVAQDNSASNFRSPSLNSSTANSLLQASKEAPPANNDHLNKHNVQKEPHFTGSLWCGSDKEDLGSSNANLGQLSSCTNADCVGLYKGKYALYEENVHLKPLDVDGFASAKEDAAYYDYAMVSGRGSNDGSDRGSTLLEENPTGKSVNCNAAVDRNSFGGGQHLLATNENSTMDMDCSGLTSFDEGNVSDMKPIAYDYRSSFREAALYKFRQKRKMRCFEKKVRYQSRKKLAEQRPRVKGQFVRRAVYDTASEVKATT